MKKIILLGLCLGTYRAEASEKISAAVLDLSVKQGVAAAMASTVSDFLRSGLFETGRFVVVDRSRMDEILKEQQFQKSGCTTNECAVEMGRLLNVGAIIVGNITKLGEKTIIEISMVDVATAKTELTDSVECIGDDLLRDAVKGLAAHFSRGVSIQAKILKVLHSSHEVIVGLGTKDNVVQDQELPVKRLKEEIKDDKGIVAFREYEQLGKIRLSSLQPEASKAKILGSVGLSEGDIAEIPAEKLKPLDTYRLAKSTSSGEETGGMMSGLLSTPRGGAGPEKEWGGGRIAVGLAQRSDWLLGTENSSGVTTSPKTKFGYVAPHLVAMFDFPLESSASFYMGLPLTFEWPTLEDGSQKPFKILVSNGLREPRLINMGMGLVMRIYPFTSTFQENGIASTRYPRGIISPYLTFGGMGYFGVFLPYVTLKGGTDPDDAMSLAFGFGGQLGAGIEAGPFFLEFMVKPFTAVSGSFEPSNANGSKTLVDFKMESAQFSGGFRF